MEKKVTRTNLRLMKGRENKEKTEKYWKKSRETSPLTHENLFRFRKSSNRLKLGDLFWI
jgi:hypothetical protein